MTASLSPVVQRVLIEKLPFREVDRDLAWIDQGKWPADWITHPAVSQEPCRIAFKMDFRIEEALQTRIHVAGDERYELFLDGHEIGWGSERGTLEHWFFDSYDLTLQAGAHTMMAVVTAHGPHGMISQLSLHPAFLLAAEDARLALNTGRAEWVTEMLEIPEYELPFPAGTFNIGWNTIWRSGVKKGPGRDWCPAKSLHPGSSAGVRTRHERMHLLAPAGLPVSAREIFRGGIIRHLSREFDDKILAGQHLPEEAAKWAEWWKGNEPIALKPNQQRRILMDLEDYVCAWPELVVSEGKGAEVRVFWAESLFDNVEEKKKGNRSEVEGKIFTGVGDRFYPDGSGSEKFRGPFIRTGRYVEVRVKTGGEGIVLNSLNLHRAEYPLEITCKFKSEKAELDDLLQRCRRTLLASSHDSLIDGPYYEQMAWIGDIPQDALALYTITPDDRLVRKALESFDQSRLPNGQIRAQWPSRRSTVLPGFSLHWIGILHDFSWWRNDRVFVQKRLPGQRAILDYFLNCIGEDRLLRLPFGWCFSDWVHGWVWGNPPMGKDQVSALFHWQLIHTLQRAAVVEEGFGEPEMATRYRRWARDLASSAEVFWNEDRGLYADTTGQESFSEHVQAMALLSGLLETGRHRKVGASLVNDPGLTRATISFSHYVFEALRESGQAGRIWERLSYWLDLEKSGLLTTPEGPEPTRSDCHGWGCHPHHHLYASLLGIRPGSPGFRSVSIQPAPGSLKKIDAVMPHPDGEIKMVLCFEGTEVSGEIILPPGIGGKFVYDGKEIALKPGRNGL